MGSIPTTKDGLGPRAYEGLQIILRPGDGVDPAFPLGFDSHKGRCLRCGLCALGLSCNRLD